MSMTKPIPQKMRDEMSQDKFYSRCCLAGLIGIPCSGRIEWHHNFTYKGTRINEPWCILPVCHNHHENEKRSDVKELLNWIMLNRKKDFSEYDRCTPSLDYQKKRLNEYYGIWHKVKA